MGQELFLLLDIALFIAGIALVVAPAKVYSSGKTAQEKKELTPKGKIGVRIFGVATIVLSALFLWADIRGRLG